MLLYILLHYITLLCSIKYLHWFIADILVQIKLVSLLLEMEQTKPLQSAFLVSLEILDFFLDAQQAKKIKNKREKSSIFFLLTLENKK